MKMILYQIAALAISTLIAQASGAIQLELSSTECLPGDLIELRAKSTTQDFQEFSLSIPANKNLLLIAHEVSPVTLTHEQYSQSHLWIFQAIAPGEINLSGITAQFTEDEEPKLLNPLTLTIGSYETLDSDPTPASFPESSTTSSSHIFLWSALSISLFGIGGLILAKNRKPDQETEQPTPPSLHALKEQLTQGKLSDQLCYDLLEQTDPALSDAHKKLIERALYQPNFSASELLIELNKESRS
ncbi:hypothetical protein [Rubritalea sp.]|uniref:hypothetical protein n=1 Tax=Rubritalea sp. TaxID=2109375 RepID=UPI003F4AB4D1